MVKLIIEHKIWPVAGTFRISRSALTEIHTVWVTLRDGEHRGRGECRPYARYGDSVESVMADIDSLRSRIESGLSLDDLQNALPAGPARNALDCAMWDLKAKQLGQSIWALLNIPKPLPRNTAYTLSLDTPKAMAQAALKASRYSLLKIKVGGDDAVKCVKAICAARPDASLIVDANEAITENLGAFYAALTDLDIVLIEQPITAGQDHPGSMPKGAIPFCADESLHTKADLPRLRAAGYRALNVKLDKCGGLTSALGLIRTAKSEGFTIMAGCMVASSLAMAPMMVLESFADYIDLDGPLLIGKDCESGLEYDGPVIHAPTRELWG